MLKLNEKTDRKQSHSFLKTILFCSFLIYTSASAHNRETTKPIIKNVVDTTQHNWFPKSEFDIYQKYQILKTQKITNKVELYQYMKSMGIKFPELVWSQAMVESSFMKSGLFTRSNNLFGMTKSESRPNVQIHIKGDRYSHFESIKKCVIDYSLHQNHVLNITKIKTEAGYMNKLKATGYAADKKYTRKILALREKTDFKSML